MGRRESIDWAPRLCDLPLMNFSIWGMMKYKFCRGKPRALSQLQASIKSEFKQINANKVLCRKVCNFVLNRMEKCVAQYERQFEQF